MRKRGAIKNDNLPLKSFSVNLPAKKVLRTPRKDEFYIIVLSGGGGGTLISGLYRYVPL